MTYTELTNKQQKGEITMKTNFKKSFLGILLITIGILYLLTNIGVIPLGLREIIVTYWPLVIVIWAGIRLIEGFFLETGRKRKFNRIYWSLGFIIIGAVLLENRINYFTEQGIGLWGIVFSIILIYVGLSIVFFKSNGMEFKITGDEPEETRRNREQDCEEEFERETFEEDLPENEIKERIKQKKHKIKEKVRDSSGYKDKKEQQKKKHSRVYNFEDIKASKDRFHFIGEIRLGDQPWALENSSYSLGVGEVYMDLTTALLEEGVTYVNLSGWVGSVQIIVPEDLAIDVSADVNVGSVEIFGEEQEFSKHSKQRRSGVSTNLLCYRSKNYDQALKKVRINASVNIGEVSVKRVG